MRALARWALGPIFRLLLRLHRAEDDWREIRRTIPFWRFGPGSRHRFSWYFEGESGVSVTSLEDVVEWLVACEYVGDKELFQEADFWQHPRTFERLRQGDCEDFALWGWRKLNKLGIPAEFFVGKVVEKGQASIHGHAWVVFDRGTGPMVLETATRTKETAVAPLDECRDQYRPHYSVDASYRTTAYEGWVTTQKEDLERKRKFGRRDIVGG